MIGWHRGDRYRDIDPGHDPRDDEDHSGELEQEDDDCDEPDCEAYEYDQIETP